MLENKVASEEPEARSVRVGDFFQESWGYDQTNVDFYEVVRISASGKTVWLQHVESSLVRSDGSADYVAPVPGSFKVTGIGPRSDGLLKRSLRSFDCGNGVEWSVRMTSYSNAYLWNCVPAYQTALGWGH